MFGCGAPALYGPHSPSTDSSVIVDRGICVVSAVHETLRSAGERCGPVEFAIPAGQHEFLAVYRADPYLEDSGPFLLDLRARPGHRYRVSAVAMVGWYAKGVPDCDQRGALVDNNVAYAEFPERISCADSEGGSVLYSRQEISDRDLKRHRWKPRCRDESCSWCK